MRDGWREVQLGSLVERRTDFVPVVPDQEYAILGVQRSGWGFVEREPIKGSDQKFTKLMQVAEDDLVYRTITAFEAPSAVVGPKEAGKYVTPQTFPVFRIDRLQMLPRFMKALTTWPTFHEEMSSRCTGSVLRRKTLSIGAFESIPVALPPLNEQRRIVDVVGALDDTIAAADRLVTGAATAHAALRRQVFRNADRAVALDDVAQVQLGRMLSRERTEGAEQAPYVRNANVQWSGLDLSDLKTMSFPARDRAKYELQAGDILVCEGGDPGRAVLLDEDLPGIYYQKALHRVRVVSGVQPAYLYHWLAEAHASGVILDLCTVTTIKHLTAEKFRTLQVPLLDQAGQTKALSLLRSSQEAHARTIALTHTLRELRANLLTALLSGEHPIPESYDELMEELAA